MRRLLFVTMFSALAGAAVAAAEYPQMGPDIFDPRANGTKLVDAALAKAGAENKRALLLFGAAWAVWERSVRDDRRPTTDDHSEEAESAKEKVIGREPALSGANGSVVVGAIGCPHRRRRLRIGRGSGGGCSDAGSRIGRGGRKGD